MATVQEEISLRDAALEAALNIPILPDGPLSGKRVRVSVDGGRVRTRITKKGRKTKNIDIDLKQNGVNQEYW